MTKTSKQEKTIQSFTGKVVSTAPQKTVVVEVKSRKRHPKYLKAYTVTKKYYAHDEQEQYQVGDDVVIYPSRPYSKLKKFVVAKKSN